MSSPTITVILIWNFLGWLALINSENITIFDSILNYIEKWEKYNNSSFLVAQCIHEISQTQFVSEREESRVILSLSYSNAGSSTIGRIVNALLQLISEDAASRNITLMIRGDSKPENSTNFTKADRQKNKYQYYILIADDDADLLETFNRTVLNDIPFNPEAKFIVYLKNGNLTRSQLEDCLVALKKNAVRNVLLVTTDKQDASIQRIYRFQPFGFSEYCGQNYRLLMVSTSCVNGSLSKRTAKLFWNRDMLTKEQKFNMEGCKITAIANTWIPYVINISAETINERGIEIKLLNDIGNHLNCTFVFNQSDSGWGVEENGSWTGLLQNITDDVYLIGIGNVHLEDAYSEFFELSLWYYFEDITWLVPTKTNEKAQWIRFIIMFSLHLWVTIAVSIVIFSFLISFWSGFLKKDKPLQRFGEAMMNSILLFAGLPPPNRPKTSIIRMIFVGGSFLGLHISALYNTGLLTVLTQPWFENQIQSESEIRKSNLGILAPSAFREFFNNSDDEEIYKKFQIETPDKPLPYYLNQTNIEKTATLANRMYVEYLINKNDPSVTRFEKNGENKTGVHFLDTPVSFYPISIVARRGFLFMNEFNEIISLYVSSGITNQWLKSEKYKIKLLQRAKQKSIVSEQKALNLFNTHGPFSLFIMGCSIGLVFLVLEFIFFKRKLIIRKLKSTKKNFLDKKRPEK